MYRHVVMWKFKNEAEGRSKLENMNTVKERLYGLLPLIPEIKKMEICMDIGGTPMSYDMMLDTLFDTKEAYDVYAVHPSHMEVKKIVAATKESRVVLDCEL